MMKPEATKEAEQAVIGSMFLEKNALQKACEVLNPESFYFNNNAKIFGSSIFVNKASVKQETEINEPQKETVQFNISQYYNNETVQVQVNNQTYSIQLSPDIRPRQQLILKNGGTPINGNARDLILVLDYDNENGTYLINGDDVYQYITFDKLLCA